VLASWYCEAENYDQPIIVIIDDMEQCSGGVLGELVMLLSEWVIKILIFFVMGIATTLDAPKKLLSSEALQRLEPCKLALGSPLDRMNALVEVILVKSCAGFCIDHQVEMFLRTYFCRHDGTITSFISALKLACSKHFSLEPLSFLCIGMLEDDCEEFWRDKFEALPQQIRKYAFGLPSCASAKNSSNSSNSMVEGLSNAWQTRPLSCIFYLLYAL
jgi:origin recognition complex subunit 3